MKPDSIGGRGRRWTFPFGARTNNVVINVAIVSCAVLVTFGIFEFVVFRFVLPAPDVPQPVFQDGVVKYAPNQRGINRVGDEITAPWQVNANGWMSSFAEYQEAKPAGTYRIAMIGDSYIEGLAVEPTANVAEQLQNDIGNPSLEVYRFGIAGAPLSQYLHMLRREVCRYRPNLVIVNLVHNDFRNSYTFDPRAFASSFLKLEFNGGGVDEIEPRELVQPWYQPILAGFATARYLARRYNLQFKLHRRQLARDVPASESDGPVTPRTEVPSDPELVVTEYLIQKLRLSAANCGARLALVIDGDRHVIYDGRTEPSAKLRLNEMVSAVARRHHVPFLDLHGVFRHDYLEHGQKFNSAVDYHWNERGHAVAAKAIKQLLVSRGLIPAL
jgi:GDSL-like Lipase/Acylhydrolase family